MKITRVAALVLSTLAMGQAQAAGMSVFAGISGSDESTFGYIGGVYAMNGDIAKEGLLLRGLLSYGEYDYDTTGVVGGNVEGEAIGAELGVGYQWVNPGSRVSLYAGIDHQDHDLSPADATNSVNGDETGAQIQAEIETLGTPWYGSLIGKYSSAFDTHWVRGRVGYTFGNITVGPEALSAGNDEYEETQFGLFLNMPISNGVTLSVSAGHREAEGDNARDDQSGGYAGLSFNARF